MEHMVEKGEIAHFEQFTFFHNIFLKLFFFNVLKWVYMEERLKRVILTQVHKNWLFQ